jgi:PTH1 family peptidyl-tRNA hydrolase
MSLPPTWLIVGLGNPGPEYRGTRHNVGFDVIDFIAEQARIKLDKSKHKSRYGMGMVADESVILMKPLTFMNLSGQAVAPLAREWQIKPDHILVITDDLDLQVGRVRLKPKGSAGGHNGHKSLIHSLGTMDYPRLKIGIGSVNRTQTIDHVLGKFHPDERDAISIAIQRAADGVEIAVSRGLEAAISAVNT